MPSDLERIEQRIDDLVREHLAVPDAEIAASCRDVLHEVATQAVVSSQGGKRLRARLALAAFDAAGLPVTSQARDAMTDLACAIEVFQTAALVHDDIIDDSDLRRGKPSAHRALAQQTHSESIGRGLGLMLGDILATVSISIANAAASSLGNPDTLRSVFLGMQRDVSVGQVLDLAVELTPLSDPARLADASLNVFRWKSASYTTMAPLQLGLTAAGTDPQVAGPLSERIGKPLGVGILGSAMKKGVLGDDGYAQMLAATTRLNKVGPALAALAGVHALTDVTGFGLLGHLLEICRGAGLAAKVSAARLPVMPAAVGFAKQGIGPGAIGRNLASYGLAVNFEEGVEDWQRSVMADAQTSGGLMVACDAASADEVMEVFRQGGFADAAVIGHMEAGLPKVHVTA